MKEVGCSESTVRRTVQRFQNTGSDENIYGRGRKPALTVRDIRYLGLSSMRDRRKTAAQLAEEFNMGRKLAVSRKIVYRALSRCGLHGRVAAKKPLLRKVNIRKRLRFAKEHVDWTIEQWHQVLWTDESKIEFFGGKRRVYVRRRTGERFKSYCLVPTVKFGGGSLMVWAAISANGAAPLKRIKGIMDQHMYHGILTHHAIPAGKKLIGQPFVFQEDNDPKHSSIKCRTYVARQEGKGREINF